MLIVTIALLMGQGFPGWWAPLLKFGFTLSYVLLAPIVGPLADAVPKARLMAWMNGVKMVGVLGLLAGVHPMAAFTLIMSLTGMPSVMATTRSRPATRTTPVRAPPVCPHKAR